MDHNHIYSYNPVRLNSTDIVTSKLKKKKKKKETESGRLTDLAKIIATSDKVS